MNNQDCFSLKRKSKKTKFEKKKKKLLKTLFCIKKTLLSTPVNKNRLNFYLQSYKGKKELNKKFFFQHFNMIFAVPIKKRIYENVFFFWENHKQY